MTCGPGWTPSSPNTRRPPNQEFAFLRRFFGWCVEQDIIAGDPCASIKRPAEPVERDRLLSDDELKQVWLAAEQLAYPFGRMVQMLILTGQRRDEVARMRWSELDLDGRAWTNPGEQRGTRKITSCRCPMPRLIS